MAPPKKVDLDKAAKEAKKRADKLGPFVQVRVVRRAQYGYPYARLLEPGDQVRLYLKDCYQEPRSGENPITGLTWKNIDVNGTEYGLPSWAVDVNDPVEEDDAQEQFVAAVSGRPVQRRGADEDADDVL